LEVNENVFNLRRRELYRREFLKTSAAIGATLMAGDILKGGSSAAHASSVKIPEVDKLVITVITDNYYDCLRWNLNPPDFKFVKRSMILPGTSLHAEHGLAYTISRPL